MAFLAERHYQLPMRYFKAPQSTPLKLALVFSGLFLAAFLVTGLSVYEIMRWEMLKHHDKRIVELYTSIAENRGNDATDFLETVEANIRASHGHDRVILATKPDGAILAGNIPPLAVPDGWSTIPAYKLGLHGHRPYRLLAGNTNGDRLIVGQSYQDIVRLRTTAAIGFGWASIIVILLALIGGSLLARKARQRLRVMQDTMERISKGDLSARLPLLDNGDDIDQLSVHFNHALQKLEASVDGMRQVSADIAHDLKTPLNRLRIIIEEARKSRNGRTDPMLDDAVAEIHHVTQTFDALLRISQLEAGARRRQFRILDLNDTIREAVDLYDGAFDESRYSLSVFLDPQGCILLGDRELLIQMYCNLIENTLRHCPPVTHIRVTTSHESDALVAIFEDDGIGIPADEREKVFRRLYRLERSRSTPGTGLGLSLIKAIADLHDAQIVLEDAKPGLRVVIRFHAAQIDSDERISLTAAAKRRVLPV